MGLQRLISFKQVKLSSAVVVLLLQNTLLPVVREIVLAFLVQAEGQFLFLVYRANFRATKELETCTSRRGNIYKLKLETSRLVSRN